MLKNELSQWIRRTGLMPLFDKIYFYLNKIYFTPKNNRFRKQNPELKIPPDYLIYESFRMDYANYFNDGKDTAEWLVRELSPYLSPRNLTVLDWGCGPARVVRHLSDKLQQSRIYAADYNAQTITWCKENIPGIDFVKNSLDPPLPYPDIFFDFIYALSVLTHLSEDKQGSWVNEVHRVLKPGGVFILTTQGSAFINKLSGGERKRFFNGSLVVREKVKEGHRSFSAFQPKTFMESIFSNRWTVLKFTEGGNQHWGPEQDTWIVQKLA